VASGAPISTALLGLDGMWGPQGLQLMYVLERSRTVLICVAVFFYLTDRPEKAHWLSAEERGWLRNRITGEHKRIERSMGWHPSLVLGSQGHAAVANYIGIVTASLGMLLFLPTIVKELGISNMQVGWVTMIPYTCGAIAMVFCGWLSDRLGDAAGPFLDLRPVGCWPDRSRLDDRHLVVRGRHVDPAAGSTAPRAVLVDADDVPDRHRRRLGHRLDQLARNLGGFFGRRWWLGPGVDGSYAAGSTRWPSARSPRR